MFKSYKILTKDMQYGWVVHYWPIVQDLVKCTIQENNISNGDHKFVVTMLFLCIEINFSLKNKVSIDALLYLFLPIENKIT